MTSPVIGILRNHLYGLYINVTLRHLNYMINNQIIENGFFKLEGALTEKNPLEVLHKYVEGLDEVGNALYHIDTFLTNMNRAEALTGTLNEEYKKLIVKYTGLYETIEEKSGKFKEALQKRLNEIGFWETEGSML